MTKIFASDFDGTLYFHGDEEPIRRRDLAAIRAFQEEGGLFGACTGRAVRALTTQTWGVIPFDFYIALTGAALFDRDLNPIFEYNLPRELVHELYDRYASWARDGLALPTAAGNYWIVGETSMENLPLMTADTFDDIPDPVHGMGIETETVETAIDLAAEINANYGAVACAYVNLNSIDILPVGHSKGTGLHRTAAHYGASLTGGIGDSLNDLPLLEGADVAYTFNDSVPAMHAAADVLVDSVSEALADFMGR